MLILTVHNVHNVQRLLDIVKLFISVKHENKIIVVSKPSGPAAIDGVAEANKLTFKNNEKLLVVGDLQDLEELLNPDKTYLATPGIKGEPLEDVVKEALKNRWRTAFIVPGQETGFTKQELAYGTPVKIQNLPENPPPTAVAAILTYTLNNHIEGERTIQES